MSQSKAAVPASIESLRASVQRAIERATSSGAQAADAVLVVGDSFEARVRDREIDFVKQAQGRTLGIRALVAGDGGLRSAVTSTSDLSDEAVLRLADETVDLARATAPDPTAGLPEDGFATEIPDLILLDEGDRNVSVEARVEDAREAEAAARASDPRIQNSEGTQVGTDFGHVVYGNSRGFLGDYASASHSLFSEPLAIEGEVMQRDYWMTVARTLSGLESPAEVGRTAAARAVRRLGAKRVSTCEVPVLFDAITAPSLLRQLLSCVSGYAVYRQASFLAEKMGERIACEGLHVRDDGRRISGLGSKPFDGEGLPTRRTDIVENGVLESWLLDSYSGRKLGLPSTGNASRSAGSAPGVAPTNCWIEPGTQSFEEIVASTERGLWVTELIGMGFSPVTGDYSRGAAGLWIENGEVVHAVEEITIAAHFGEMLRDIDAIASELRWTGRVASPGLRIARMTLAGE